MRNRLANFIGTDVSDIMNQFWGVCQTQIYNVLTNMIHENKSFHSLKRFIKEEQKSIDEADLKVVCKDLINSLCWKLQILQTTLFSQ